MENMNYEKLSELGIFEIRNLAREVGVYSPTTLKKQELIEKILNVIDGREEPYIKKTKQGRPPKSISSLNNLMDVIVPAKFFETKNENNLKNIFNDLNESINVNVIGSNETNFNALIKVYDNNEYALAFLNKIEEIKQEVVFINRSQVKFYKLKSGDFISGKYVFVSNDKPLILKEIYSINEISVNQTSSRVVDFYEIPADFPNKKLKLNIYKEDDEIFDNIDLFAPLAKGQRVLLECENYDNMLNFQILNRLSTGDNNLTGLAILIDEMPENYYEILTNKKIDTLSNNYNKISNLKLEIEVKIAKLLRHVEQGEDVVLFVNDIQKYLNYVQNNYILAKKSIEESKILAIEELKNIILLGKNSKLGGSLTIIFGSTKSDNNFTNLFNNYICYFKKNYEFVLNKANSNTFNIEKILTKTELQKYIQLKNN